MKRRSNEVVYSPRSKKLSGRVVCSDAIEFLRSLPADCARIVFLDPPFNLGKQYDKNKRLDRRPQKEYEEWLVDVAFESVRVLEPGGSLFLYYMPSWGMRVGSTLG